jgi:hypothetical protein
MIFNKALRQIPLAIATIAFSAASALAQSSAGTPVESTSFGIQSYAGGQTARLSIGVRRPASIREIIPCVRVRVVVEVYGQDPANRLRLVVVRTIEQEFTLDSGEAVSLNLPGTRLGEAASITVYAYRMSDLDPIESVKGAALSSLQVVESGRTVFTHPGVIRGFNPQPDPPSGIDQ